MAKMENLSHVEEAMFKFLRTSFHVPVNKLKPNFEKLLEQVKPFEKKTAEARAFAYLDVISWLESRIQGVPVEHVIKRKFEEKGGGGGG
jgi:coproporphyrinogen III oxidase-like Fe-S oxidoreductase